MERTERIALPYIAIYSIAMYSIYHVSNRQLVESCCSAREFSCMLCDDLEGWDVGVGGSLKRGGMSVYL